MLQPKTSVFFRLPKDDNRRVLHAATVLSRGEAGSGYTAELKSASLKLEAGQELLLYFQIRNAFQQQPIRIDAIMADADNTVVGFTTTGDPVSAETRQCFRVTTVISGLTASVGEEPKCQVNDVSASGFSIVSSNAYTVGTVLPVTISHEGKKYSGEACVQSIREMEPGKVRYGLFCLTTRKHGSGLATGLGQITNAVQRVQLRRLAGA